MKPYIFNFCLKDRRHACATFAEQTVLPGSPGDCLGLQHLRVNEFTTVLWDSTVSTNGLFGTLIGVAASYVFKNLAL